MNPITSFIKSTMVPPEEHYKALEDRVAKISIESVRYHDEERNSENVGQPWLIEMRREDFSNKILCANSSYKGTEAGSRNSYKACRYYSQQAKDRLKLIQKEIQEEEMLQSHKQS